MGAVDGPEPAGVETASRTDVGRKRASNQDAFGEFTNPRGFRLLVLADGMGGHAGGEVASKTAVEAISDVFDSPFDDPGAMLRRAFEAANTRVYRMAAEDPSLYGMGTTASALLLGPTAEAWFAHVGDSRVYRSRDGGLETLTEDHSWVHEQVRNKRLTLEQAGIHPMRNSLLRSVGVAPEVEIDVERVDVQPGDRFLLCSDGLWGEVDAGGIARALDGDEPEEAARKLVELANQNGGADNITVQIARVAGAPAERKGRLRRWLGRLSGS